MRCGCGIFQYKKLCRKINPGDIVLLQYPVNRLLMKRIYKMLNRKQVHSITLIHDIDYLRNVPLGNRGVVGMKNLELFLLSQSEYLICHNDSMIKVLKDAGLKSNFVSLRLFDYLYEGAGAKKIGDGSVVVAGNLLEKKAGYLYGLSGQKFKLSLYGSNLGENFNNPNAEYHGSFPPDRLIENIEGDYGLVWDGPSTDACTGDYGNYLKVNNPHKVSLYLAAGLPVIVWKESAVYRFIIENGVGFGIGSLSDIDEEIKKHDHAEMAENVKKIQKKIRTGYFIKTALGEVEKKAKEAD